MVAVRKDSSEDATRLFSAWLFFALRCIYLQAFVMGVFDKHLEHDSNVNW